MKILDSWIVEIKNEGYQLLVHCGGDKYIRTSSGAFGQRGMTWVAEYEEEALRMINESKQNGINE